MPATRMVDLSLALLDGEIARKSGRLGDAVKHFQAAAALEKALPYSEPPYWHQPVSHILGAALIQDHRPSEAEAVYRESLKTYRADGWALFGLFQALQAEGRRKEASEIRRAFDQAWALADVKLTASRF